MADWKELVSDVLSWETGEVRTVEKDGKSFCVSKAEDGFGVIDNECEHEGGPLGGGRLENGKIACPWHGWEFDHKKGTGKVKGYETKIEGETLLVSYEGISDEESSGELVWHKVLDSAEDLPEGRVVSAWAGHKGLCISHYKGEFAALDNKCPHQGGPLGEGSIENGYLRCPWHGWDFHPTTGASPGGFDDHLDSFEVNVREDGVYVAVPEGKAA